MNVYIIGGGASGLVAGIISARNNHKVTILEKNNTCGKKLLLTGNGKCNFYNEDQQLKYYHTNNKKEFKNIFAYTNQILLFFKTIGIIPQNKNGYYYPYSNQSTSILNALLKEAEKLNIKIITNQNVTKIEKKEQFIIHTNENIYKADKIIIATGSKAYPKTGSNGEGYKLAKQLGHTIKPIYPALTMLKSDQTYNWEGIRTPVTLTLKLNNQTITKEQGEIQLIKNGISGIVTFNISHYIFKNKNIKILIDFVPWFTKNEDEFIKWLDNQSKKLKYPLKNILEGFLNYKLVNFILEKNKYPKDILWENCNKQKIVNDLKQFTFKPNNDYTYDKAQTCQGGIPLEEINTTTMESKITKGLYFTGEIIDVHADCGGYNLSFAFMTAFIAGKLN